MGSPRPRPKHLAKKLLQIRLNLGVSQRELLKRLGVSDQIPVLLAYSRAAGIPLEQIVDHEINLTRIETFKENITCGPKTATKT